MEPVIKVRYKMRLRVLTYCLMIVFSQTRTALAGGCDKTPKDQYASKSEGDNGFAIQINGSPRLYRPNQIYTITLKSVNEEQITKFSGFLLVADPAEGSKRPPGLPVNVGTLQLMPGEAMTKFSHKCSNAIEATSSISKEQIQVYWTSPPRGSGCIQFSAMVIERQDVWYMDEGGLTYTLCEDNSPLAEPPIVEPCCACDEAKYEVIFEGIWSRHTHPKDFPKDEWRTQFSKLIGASHSVNYTLWEYGRPASIPLQILAEHGITRRLETEMKSYSNSIRSVIKAHGLHQRSNVVGQTFAVFRVDPMNHLLSIVSKMIPSPDWIVGLSKENLCLPNCSWVANRVIDLYPWDVGTQSGLAYDAPPSLQSPRGVIQRITSTNPNAEESPFYDPTGAPMKPAARLHIIRQREYRKACPDHRQRIGGSDRGLNPSWSSNQFAPGFAGGASTGYDNPENTEDSYIYTGEGIGQQLGFGYDDYGYNSGPVGDSSILDPCQVSEWGMWSDCSATCGPASRSRTRSFVDAMSAQENYCSEDLWEKEPCRNPRCPPRNYGGSFQPFTVGEEDTSIPGYSSAWLERGLESDGLQAPNSYLYETGKTKNLMYGTYGQSYSKPVDTNPYQRGSQRSSAYTAPSDYPANEVYSYTYGGNSLSSARATTAAPPYMPNYAPLKDESPVKAEVEVDCSLSEWGEWSDCSSECDRGIRTRSRRYINHHLSSHCSAELDGMEPCHGHGPLCPPILPEEAEESVREDGEFEPEIPPFDRLGAGYSKPHYQEDHEMCATSEWSEWSPCSQTCGEAVFKTRTRLFLIPFVEDRSCDLRLIETEACNVPRCYGNYGVAAADSFQVYPSQNNYREDLENLYDDDNDWIGSLTFSDSTRAEEQPLPERPGRCNLKPNRGSCSGVFTRWYYDPDSDTCKTFTFYGCKGNKNNFASEEQCLETCGPQRSSTASDSFEETGFPTWSFIEDQDASLDDKNSPYMYGKLKPMSLVQEQYGEGDDHLHEEEGDHGPNTFETYSNAPEVDCIVSSWSEWSPCSKSCGSGWSTRDREIIIEPANGGKSCPKKLHRKRKCRVMPCPADTKYWYHGSWRHMA